MPPAPSAEPELLPDDPNEPDDPVVDDPVSPGPENDDPVPN